jgi:hypothetical protein
MPNNLQRGANHALADGGGGDRNLHDCDGDVSKFIWPRARAPVRPDWGIRRGGRRLVFVRANHRLLHPVLELRSRRSSLAFQSQAPYAQSHRPGRVSHANDERLKTASNARGRSRGEPRSGAKPRRRPGDLTRAIALSGSATQAGARPRPGSHALAFPALPGSRTITNPRAVTNYGSRAGPYPTSSASSEPHGWSRRLTSFVCFKIDISVKRPPVQVDMA